MNTQTISDVVKGYLAEIRVLPMTICVLTVLLGGLFARGPNVDWSIMGLVLLNAFCYLYVAHLNDTFFDLRKGEYGSDRKYHSVRSKEDEYLPRWGFGPEIPDAPILSQKHYLIAMIVTSLIGLAVMIYISTIVGWMYSLVAIVGLFLAITYSAGVDKIPILGDTWWEIGIVFALYAGYCSQTGYVDSFIVLQSVPLFIILTGVKLMDSIPDTKTDDRVNKRTLAVLLYRRGLSLGQIRHVAFIPIYLGFLLLLFMAPPFIKPFVVAVLAMIACVHAGLRKDIECRKTVVASCFVILFFIISAISSILSVTVR